MTRGWVEDGDTCKSPGSLERLHQLLHGHLTQFHPHLRLTHEGDEDDSSCAASSPAWHHQPVHHRHTLLYGGAADAKSSTQQHAARAIIFLTRPQQHAGSFSAAPSAGPPSPRRSSSRWSPRRLAFSLACCALLVLLLAKIFHMGSSVFSNPAFGQELAGIGVLRRSRQQHAAAQHPAATDTDLFMELTPQLHAAQDPTSAAAHAATPPTLRIPRIVHQIFHGRVVYNDGQAYVTRRHHPSVAHDAIAASWQQHNGQEWQHRFYDDEACMAFVEAEFPQYLEAYSQLPHLAERHDFFRWVHALEMSHFTCGTGI